MVIVTTVAMAAPADLHGPCATEIRQLRVLLAAERARADAAERREAQTLAVNQRLGEALRRERREAALDRLTGIPNRAGLTTAYHASRPAWLMLFDLDGFKAVNDEHGHEAGDWVLQMVASRLCARDGIRPARLHGDELVVLVDNPRWQVDQVALWLGEQISRPILLPNGVEVQVTASIGVAPVTRGDDLPVLLGRADAAMYMAKHAGRHCHRMWVPAPTPPQAGAGRRTIRDRVRRRP